MRKVYTSSDLNLVQYAKSVLESYKIRMHDHERATGRSGGGMVGIAPFDAWTELWAHNVTRKDVARQLIDSAMKKTETQPQQWHCPGCSENFELQLTQCWKCETEND